MKKEELKSLLGRGGEMPDLGPIEAYLDALATERRLPISQSRSVRLA